MGEVRHEYEQSRCWEVYEEEMLKGGGISLVGWEGRWEKRNGEVKGDCKGNGDGDGI